MAAGVIRVWLAAAGTGLAAMLLAGCASAVPLLVHGPSAHDLSFHYSRHGSAAETIDQTLHIRNAFGDSVVPVLTFTAMDAHGKVLPQVKVGTVYGSDQGNLVVPYGWGFDILRFSGAGEHAGRPRPVREQVLPVLRRQSDEPRLLQGLVTMRDLSPARCRRRARRSDPDRCCHRRR